MRKIQLTILSVIALLFAYPAFSQALQHFSFVQGVVSNSVPLVLGTAPVTINGVPVSALDEIGVFTPDGICAGALVYGSNASNQFTAWGFLPEDPDNGVPETPGFNSGQPIVFRVWDHVADVEYTNVCVSFTNTNGLFNGSTSGFYQIASLYANTDAGLPIGPVLMAPDNNATNIALRAPLKWRGSFCTSAPTYRLQISTSSNFGTTAVNRTVTSTAVGVSVNYTLTVAEQLTANTFYWRVRVEPDGNWSDVRTFATVGAVTLNPPVLTTPENNATSVAVLPAFGWTAAANATSYNLQVSTTSDFATQAINVNGLTGTTYQAVTSLSENTQYFWRMQSVATGTSAWSAPFAFTTVAPVLPPVPPTLVTPVYQATNVAVPVTFEWTPVENVTTYEVEIATANNFANPVYSNTISGVTFNWIDAANNTQYFWRVRSVNGNGNSEWVSRSFTTIPLPPAAPVLVAPLNNSTDVDYVMPQLNWEFSLGATGYYFEVSTVSTFETTVYYFYTPNGYHYIPSGTLSPFTQYFWRVKAENAAGFGPFSEIWNFKTFDAPIGNAPVLVAPINGAVNVTPVVVSWEAVTNATQYQVQVSANDDFNALAWSTTTGDLSANPGPGLLSPNTQYFWRIKAENNSFETAWSTVWSFTTMPSLPAAPVLYAPANGFANASVNMQKLDWNHVPTASLYYIQVATTSDFQQGTVVFWQNYWYQYPFIYVPELSPNTTYYWHLQAQNAAGWGPFSETWSFTTVNLPPVAPVLAAPADQAENVELLPTLYWYSADRATSYNLYYANNSDFTNAVVINGLTTLNYAIPTQLDDNTTYFWKVEAVNNEGTTFSLVRSFTTVLDIPNAPILVAPANLATGVDVMPQFAWEAADGAVTYTILYANNAEFNNAIMVEGIVNLTYTPLVPLPQGTTYFWKVYAVNNAGANVSTTWSFTTLTNPPSTAILVAPANNAVGVSRMPQFVWEAGIGATSFNLVYATNSDFTDAVTELGITGTTFTLASNLPYNTTYFWKVISVNNGGTTPSGVWSFTTEVEPVTNKVVNVTLFMDGMYSTANGNRPCAVAIELRSGSSLMTSTVVARKAGIVGTNGLVSIDFTEVPNGDYYVVARAAGYMPLAAPNALTLSNSGINWNFTTALTQAIGGVQVLKSSGSVYLMRAGDFDGSRSVNTTDINRILQSNGKNVASEVPSL